jgi:hypothetical protein
MELADFEWGSGGQVATPLTMATQGTACLSLVPLAHDALVLG